MAKPTDVAGNDAPVTERYASERRRILEALRPLTEGGVAENIEHIGSSSVPGLEAGSGQDILVAAWPFPLPPDRAQALERMGYTRVADKDETGVERFARGSDIHLHIVEAGSEAWTERILFRDYLRHAPEAARTYGAGKLELAEHFGLESASYRDGKAQLIEGLMRDARAWYRGHVGFAPVFKVADELSGFEPAWCVASGWALDLYLGQVTRVHHDIDIAVFRDDQLELQRYMTGRGWTFLTPFEKRLEPWPAQMRLELPRHQAHAHKDGRFIDFLLNEREEPVWRFRREPRIVRTLDRLMHQGESGIPFLAPEVVLLFKSAHAEGAPRGKDQLDFEAVAGRLEPEPRTWLRWALEVYRPGHAWLERL